jgi:signal transduction histidine kinase
MNIVYNIVTQKLQGDIICKSELGKGVEFVVECPLVIKDKQQKSVS